MTSKPKIHFLIERFFIIAGLAILIATLSAGLYFNKYDEQEKQKNNLQRIHRMLSQLIAPSLIISDLSEVKRLLFMASGEEETFVVVDNDGTIIMSDYEKSHFSKFVSASYKSTSDCKNLEIVYKYIDGKKYLVNCSILKNTNEIAGEKNAGTLLSFTTYKWFSFSPIIFYFVGLLIGLFLFLIILFRRMLYRRLLKPLVTLKDHILNTSITPDIVNAPRELIEIKDAFEGLLLNLQDEYGKRIEAEKMNALLDLAAAVAHDIRSPLTALDIIIKDIKNIPEEQRIVIRNSANRITDIANNLLTQYKRKKNTASDDFENIKPELLSDLLMSLISEKRVQYRNDTTKLIICLEENAYGKFSMISASAFNRVLSNLIDNSIEALSSEIKIRLSTSKLDRKNVLTIQIQDNGCGISSDTLGKITNGECVSSKVKGHGLGLLNAIKTIKKEWNGHFQIRSSVNSGTTIDITLPQTCTPKWFLSELIIDPKESIVILDDDESIHQVWKKRFKEEHGYLNFVNHYNPQDLLTWYRENKSFGENIFLIDYELIGSNKSGLSIIEELNITDRSYLVTSRHEDLSVRERCEKIGLKIIPKTFAVYIPIFVSKHNPIKPVDLIFVDDNSDITDAWKLHGLSKGKAIASYNSIRALKIDLNKYDVDTPIFIDSDLNDVMKGQDYAKELYEKGFRTIYLSTGYSRADFPEMYWIKDIVGKEPPF